MHTAEQAFDVLAPAQAVDKTLHFPDISEQIHKAGWFLLPSCTLISRAMMLEVGLFSETIRLNEDVACFLKILNRTALVVVDEPLTRWRIHDTNTHRDTVGMMRGRLALTRDGAHAHGARYPALFVERLQRELPELLVELGREEAGVGNMTVARSHLWEAMLRRPRPRPLILLVSALGPQRLFRMLERTRRLFRRTAKLDSCCRMSRPAVHAWRAVQSATRNGESGAIA